MNKEYLNVILADSDEGVHILFKNVFQDLKMGIKMQSFYDSTTLANYIGNENNSVPEILFLNHNVDGESSLEFLRSIKTNLRFDHMITAVYCGNTTPKKEEEIFLSGANIFMQQPDNYIDLKKVLTEIMIVNWQYQTSGLNKNNFIMKV